MLSLKVTYYKTTFQNCFTVLFACFDFEKQLNKLNMLLSCDNEIVLTFKQLMPSAFFIFTDYQNLTDVIKLYILKRFYFKNHVDMRNKTIYFGLKDIENLILFCKTSFFCKP